MPYVLTPDLESTLETVSKLQQQIPITVNNLLKYLPNMKKGTIQYRMERLRDMGYLKRYRVKGVGQGAGRDWHYLTTPVVLGQPRPESVHR